MTKLQDEYPYGACPSCDAEIPDEATPGDKCEFCGHILKIKKKKAPKYPSISGVELEEIDLSKAEKNECPGINNK